MMLSSCIHSFTLATLSFIYFQSSCALSVDPKAIAHLEPRLDDSSVASGAGHSSSPTRRRKKCSFTPSASVAASTTGIPDDTEAGLATNISSTSSAYGYPGTNATTLASQLPYSRTPCQTTGTIYLPTAVGGSVGGSSNYYPPSTAQAAGAGSSGSPGGPDSNGGSGVVPDSNMNGDSESLATNTGYSALLASPSGNDASSGPPGSNESGNTGLPIAGSGSPGGPACASQFTVTVTTQYTVTLTVNQAVAAPTSASPNAAADSGQAASGGASLLVTSASGSASPKRTKCSKISVSSGAASSASAGSISLGGSSPNGSPVERLVVPSISSLSQGQAPQAAAQSISSSIQSSSSTSATALASSSSILLNNSSAVVPVSANSSTSNTSNTSSTNLNGEFWAGATLTTLIRMENIPGRVFYDFDGTTVKDPFETLGDQGVNAVRIETSRTDCLGPTTFVNNGSTLGEELLFQLDWGCIDIAVQAAQRGIDQGMRVVLTINQGFTIPKELESLNYEQMIENIQGETQRQLQPFLDAKIIPDVILFENEGSDGFLFTEESNGHVRGTDDGKADSATVDKELCGLIPTGNMVSYPQYAGYLKAEIIACNDAITAAGFSTATVRYGLHSHGQYVQWKEAVVHGPNQASQTNLVNSAGTTCDNSVIPQDILSQNASELLTIMGFSAYPDPMTPTDINSPSSENATLDRLVATLTQLQGYSEAYGVNTDGPFAGQAKLQALGVEYGTAYSYDQIPQEQDLTELMWQTVKAFPNFLGLLWYEPWYCHSDWEGGQAALCHSLDSQNITGQAPTDTLKTWAAAAISPWK